MSPPRRPDHAARVQSDLRKGMVRMRGRLTKVVVVAVAVLGLGVSGCGGSSGGSGGGGSKTSLTIGAAIGMSGILAPYDKPPFQAAQIEADHLNAAGGIGGRKVKFVTQDMRSQNNEAPRAAQAVIDRGANLLTVPCDPDFAAPGSTVGQSRGVLTFSLCQASSRLGPKTVGPLVFTPSHIVFLEGYVMAEWAAMQKHWKKAFVVREKSWSYTKDACTGFQNRWNELAGPNGTVGRDDLANDDTSIASTITRIKTANPKPEFIWLCSQTPEAASWIRQMRAAGLNQPILSDMAMDGSYWLNAVKNLSNFYYPAAGSVFGDDPDPKVNELVKEFTAKTGAAPQTSYALFGVALMQIYAEAVKRAGSTDGAAVVKALDGFRDVPTIVGKTSYSPDAHIVLARPMRVMQVQHGKMGYLQMWDVKKAPTLNG
jgi:branched-chain amino acid transport system substrate-binding protein